MGWNRSFELFPLQNVSAAAQQQPKADFLEGKPHRKHPGVTNLKTVRLPDELQVAAQSIIRGKFTSCRLAYPETTQAALSNIRITFPSTGAQVPKLAERCQKLANFLWSRKRAVEDLTLRQKAVSLEKELWEKAIQKIGGDGLRACCAEKKSL